MIENIQREDLNPIEEALAYKKLLDEFNLKQDEVAERVSKSRTAVTNSMRLLKLDERVQQMVIDEMISTGHARAILGITDKDKQYDFAQRVFDEKLSVRDVEKEVKRLQNEKDSDKVKEPKIDPRLEAIYAELQEQMKKIKREEEMYKLQKTHTATLTSLENSYDTVEANKKYLLATIEKNGMNIEKIVKSVNFDVKNMQSVITSLFNQTISAIKSIKVSSNSYSDNRNISIRGDSRDILNALQNRVGLAVSYGNYN